MSFERAIEILYSHYPELEAQADEKANYIRFPSICHNQNTHHPDKNLVLYKDSGLFTCFSQCNETFNIYGLIKKREKIEGKQIWINGALAETSKPKQQLLFENTVRKIQLYHKNNNLPTVNSTILDSYRIADEHNPWHLEGIDLDILQLAGIGYSIADNAVIIPHFNYKNELVGIRKRSYNFEDIIRGKYKPWSWNGILYNHPLGQNLYGINFNLYDIVKTKQLIIVESEKAVLQAKSSFGLNNVVATCGSNITDHQIKLILTKLKPQEIIIAYDKEYNNNNEMLSYFTTIKNKNKLLSYVCPTYMLLDTKDIFNYKESPFDRNNMDFKKLEKWKL